MIWGMERVFRVARFYSRGEIDLSYIGLKQAEEYLRMRLFQELSHALCEETIHYEDTKLWRRPTAVGEEVKMTWSPALTTVEIYGGPHDGTLMDIGGQPGMAVTGRRIRLPMPQDPISPVAFQEEPTLAFPEIVDYQCSGFNDQSRRWLFSPTGGRL